MPNATDTIDVAVIALIDKANRDCYQNKSAYINAVQNAAAHLSEAFTLAPGKSIRFQVGDLYLRVAVQAAGSGMEQIENGLNMWDQVFIAPGNAPSGTVGTCCGNRHGGRNTLALLTQRELDSMRKH